MIGSADKFGAGFDNLFAVATSRTTTCSAFNNIFSHCNSMDADVMAPGAHLFSIERFYLVIRFYIRTSPSRVTTRLVETKGTLKLKRRIY